MRCKIWQEGGVMRYFLDTEFSESPGTIELLSIGLYQDHPIAPVLYYAINSDADWSLCSPWVEDHVLPVLHGEPAIPLVTIRQEIDQLIGTADTPEFWGYYADYDWVNFCWIFGTMMDLPRGWPKYCRDLKQWCDQLGNPRLPPKPTGHHAGEDAVWHATIYHFLCKVTGGGA